MNRSSAVYVASWRARLGFMTFRVALVRACICMVGMWACLPGALSSSAQSLPQDRPGGVFGLSTSVIVLDVSVLDSNGTPIRGLQREDFSVIENGAKARDIAMFLPVAGGIRDASAKDLTTNGDAEPGLALNGRVMAVLLDHTIEPGAAATSARRVAEAAVAELRSADRAAVISTLPPGRSYRFTGDRERLRSEIRQMPLGTWLVNNSMEDSQCPCGVCTLETIRNIARAVQGLDSRKVLLFIGRTLALADMPVSGAGHDCSLTTQRATDEMFESIRRANLVVHAIDPAGVRTPAVYQADRRGVPPLRLAPSVEADALRTLADVAGGRAVLVDNRPELAVPDLLRTSDTYYLLAFYAARDDGTRGFRPVEVRVRQSGARVVTRCGYDLEGGSGSVSNCPGRLRK